MKSSPIDEPDNKDSDPKEVLSNLLESAEEKAKLIVSQSRKTMDSGQELADVAQSLGKVINLTNDVPDVEQLIENWEYINQRADSTLKLLNNDTGFVSGTSTTSTTATIIASTPLVYFGSDPNGQSELDNSVYELSRVLERSADKDKVISLMRSLGLDSHYAGEKSSIELFMTAHESFTKPVTDTNPVITSLVPMREAIVLVIEYLIKHRSKQEATPKLWDKFVSIGKKLSYGDIPPEFFNNLAYQWDQISNKELSPAKMKDIDRDEWRKRLIHSTLFLKSLLESIDPSKLK